MDIILIMFKGDGTRRDFPVVKPRTLIGRTNSCDLRIPVPDVSRKHCELVLEDGELVLRDLESSNGTFCNKNRVQEIELEPGDNVTVGPVNFVVQIDGEPGEVAAMPTVPGGVESAAGGLPDLVDVEAGLDMGELDAVDEDLGMPSVVPLVDDDEPPLGLEADVDDLDESVELAVEEDDPVAALEAMGEQIDSGDSGSPPRQADEDRSRDDA